MSWPKKIHMIWWQGSPPAAFQEAANKWSTMNKGWDLTIWTEASINSFIKAHYPKLHRKFKWIPRTRKGDFRYIKKCDCARFLLLDYFGGAYVDMDLQPNRPIEDLLNDQYVYLRESTRFDKIGLKHIADSREDLNPGGYDAILFREILPMDRYGSPVLNGVLLSKHFGGGTIFGDMAHEFLKGFNKYSNVLDSFGPHAIARYLRKLTTKANARRGILVLPAYYATWHSAVFGDKPWFVLCEHDGTTGGRSWGDTTKAQPWKTK